jgi:hypothetical protein
MSRSAACLVVLAVIAVPRSAAAQQTVAQALGFLLTNRSIPTDDFVQDAQAAEAMRASISTFLVTELGTLPTTSSGGGFTYRLNPEFGVQERSSTSFGPFYTERSLTLGEGQVAFSAIGQSTSFTEIDGRALRDGTLVAVASRFTGESTPFDVETLTLRLRTATMTLSGSYGIGDRVDVGASLPLVRLTLSGRRVDTYRGVRLVQATASASASGIGDVIVRGKFNVWRVGGSGISVGAEARLPTGDEDHLLGGGDATIKPRAIGSFEHGRLALHGNFGVVLGGLSREVVYNGAATINGGSRLTIVGELLGRRLSSAGRLTEAVGPHPQLQGIETIRLTAVEQPTSRAVLVAGVKWNIAATWLVSGNMLRPLTSAGVNARWVPSVAVDYSFGR